MSWEVLWLRAAKILFLAPEWANEHAGIQILGTTLTWNLSKYVDFISHINKKCLEKEEPL